MMDWDNAAKLLSAKLDPKNVQPAKSFGPKGDYIEGWHAMAEANRIFGFGEWSYTMTNCVCVSERPKEVGRDKKPGFGVTYTATVRVTVGDVVREDVGAGHGYDVDCGLAHESAIKEAATDALKRALRGFGNPFGLALYDKSRENVGVDTPPINHDDEAQRIIGRLEAAISMQELGAIWGAEADMIARINKESASAFARIEAVKDDLKKQLTKDAA